MARRNGTSDKTRGGNGVSMSGVSTVAEVYGERRTDDNPAWRIHEETPFGYGIDDAVGHKGSFSRDCASAHR